MEVICFRKIAGDKRAILGLSLVGKDEKKNQKSKGSQESWDRMLRPTSPMIIEARVESRFVLNE